ncbi:MAG TPA: hypothetical protein ENG93_01960, partial [Nitrospirae bacterium]|nr:hypothetical protein [Nitrospirota bacterium]
RGTKTRIRGLHSHGRPLDIVYAGQRVAMNLQGIEKEELRRGDVISLPDKIRPTSAIDARIELLKDIPLSGLKNRSLVHFHTGTSELTGRIIIYDREELKPGDSAYCQFRFREPVAVMSGDRYVIRRFSPLLTIGGGEILDTSPRRRKKKEGDDDLRVFEKGGLKEKLLMKTFHAGINGITLPALEGWINAELPVIKDSVKQLAEKGEVTQIDNRLLHKQAFEAFSGKVLSTVKAFHQKNPLSPGIPKEDLRAVFKWLDQRLFEGLLLNVKELTFDRGIIRLKTFKISLSGDKELLKEKILRNLERASFNPPAKDELAKSISIPSKELGELLKIMASEVSVVRINDALYISSANHKKMINGLKGFFKNKPEMTVGEFRDILGTSRKYAVPFLEYLDSNRITLRVGDVRKLLMKPD